MPDWRITRAAAHDLEEIGHFTEERWGVSQRLKYLGELERRFDHLAQNPALGRPRRDLGPGLLSHRQGRHVIFYRRTADGLLVLRVLHERMDPRRRLTEGGE